MSSRSTPKVCAASRHPFLLHSSIKCFAKRLSDPWNFSSSRFEQRQRQPTCPSHLGGTSQYQRQECCIAAFDVDTRLQVVQALETSVDCMRFLSHEKQSRRKTVVVTVRVSFRSARGIPLATASCASSSNESSKCCTSTQLERWSLWARERETKNLLTLEQEHCVKPSLHPAVPS